MAAKVEDVSASIPLPIRVALSSFFSPHFLRYLFIFISIGYSSKPRLSVTYANETDTDICGVFAVLHGPVLECRC